VTEERATLQRLFRLIGERLEGFLDGDDLALETLGESIEAGGFTAEDVQSACLVLRSIGREAGPGLESTLESAPGRDALRVLSAEERESLSPEAWGYLIALRRRGSLDPRQFERVLEMLGGGGERQIGVELAREVATRVALTGEDGAAAETIAHGDFEQTH
jgi:uncharacterized protein Smg (DUF494 family)